MIKINFLELLHQVFHKQCFTCLDCKRPLDSTLCCDSPNDEVCQMVQKARVFCEIRKYTFSRTTIKLFVYLIICAVFICDFAYLRLRIYSRTYPPIYSHPWYFYVRISYIPSTTFWFLSVACVHLGPIL